MTHDELVFEALVYRRNVGADPPSIRTYVKFREDKKHTTKNDHEALRRLEQAGRAIQVGQNWFLTPQEIKLARGSAMQPSWQPEDAVILLALLLGSKEGCDLEGIIGTVDYIDRSIPNLEMMHGALNRLAAGGLIKTRRGRYLVTEKATEIFTKLKPACRRGPMNQRRGLERMLDCPCCGVELKKVQWRITIDDAAMAEAYTRYVERMK